MEALKRERPQDVELLKILGEMYMDAGRFEDAVGTLRAVSLADNSNFEAENLLARALVKGGSLREANDQYSKLLLSYPTKGAVRLEYARLKEAQGDVDGAVALYQKQLAPKWERLNCSSGAQSSCGARGG